jgi:hypothetical protein
MIAVAIMWFYVRASTSGLSDSLQPVKVRLQGDEVRIQQNGNYYTVTDVYLEKVWRLINEWKSNGTERVPVQDFDDKLFMDNHSNSFRSRKRKFIINEINKLCDEPILRTIKNPVDKRYKDLVIDLSLIETDDRDSS